MGPIVAIAVRILLTADPDVPVPPHGYGGIERIVAGLASEYQRLGHSVGLCARGSSTAPVSFLYSWPGSSASSLRDVVVNSLGLIHAIRFFKPDLVHSFSRLAYLAPVLVSRLCPVVMSFQRHTGGSSVRIASVLGGRSLLFTGCSRFIASQGRNAGGTWESIPNFVDTRAIPFGVEVAEDAPLLFLSRIERVKGAHLAIQIALEAGCRLILAGNRSETNDGRIYWDTEIEPYLSNPLVRWVGEVDDQQKIALFSQAAALLLPIQWDEPFGIVFVEALAAGVPVITCRRGAAVEILREGITGFFIDTLQDGVAAVSKIGELSRTACRECAVKYFDSQIVAAHYVELFTRFLSGIH